jgi:hypothetical protein
MVQTTKTIHAMVSATQRIITKCGHLLFSCKRYLSKFFGRID